MGLILRYLVRNFQINARIKLTARYLLTFSYYTKPHLEYDCSVYVRNKLGCQIYFLVYRFNIIFLRLENLVQQNSILVMYQEFCVHSIVIMNDGGNGIGGRWLTHIRVSVADRGCIVSLHLFVVFFLFLLFVFWSLMSCLFFK